MFAKKKKTVCCQVWPTDICGCSPNVIGTFICMNIWFALESALSLQTIQMGLGKLSSSAPAVFGIHFVFQIFAHYGGQVSHMRWFIWEQF